MGSLVARQAHNLKVGGSIRPPQPINNLTMFEYEKNKLDFILLTFFLIYPLAILSGNFAINICFLIIGSIFL